MDQGGLLGNGEAFLPIPPDPQVIYDINVAWNLNAAPSNTTVAWTYGEGTSAHRVGPAHDLLTYFAVGSLHKYTNNSVLPDYGAYWFGAPPFHAKELARNF
jgi:hypothetical protein